MQEHPTYEKCLLDHWQAGALDDAWKQPGLYATGHYDQFARMAQIHMSSCYDPYPLTTTDNYLGLKAEGAKDLGLVLGAWTHGDRSLTYAGDVDFGEAATLIVNWHLISLIFVRTSSMAFSMGMQGSRIARP